MYQSLLTFSAQNITYLLLRINKQCVSEEMIDRHAKSICDRWTILRVPGQTLFSIFAFGPHLPFLQAAPALYPSACEADEYFAPAFHEEFQV